MWKILFVSTTFIAFAPPAISQDFLCYRVTPGGQVINLTSLCTGSAIKFDPITVSNLSLDVLNQELSSKVKATITNRSQKQVRVEVVWLDINQGNVPISTVPIYVNQTLKPGQSIPATGLFDGTDLLPQNPNQLTVSFQRWE
jgi:hypothetical protein